MCVTAYPHLLSNPFTAISSLSRVALIFKNLVVLIVYTVLIKANLFTLVLVNVCKSILYLLYNIVYKIIKCFLPISWLKSIICRLMLHFKTESFSKVPLFPTP
jgi:hypothetical protein